MAPNSRPIALSSIHRPSSNWLLGLPNVLQGAPATCEINPWMTLAQEMNWVSTGTGAGEKLSVSAIVPMGPPANVEILATIPMVRIRAFGKFEVAATAPAANVAGAEMLVGHGSPDCCKRREVSGLKWRGLKVAEHDFVKYSCWHRDRQADQIKQRQCVAIWIGARFRNFLV